MVIFAVVSARQGEAEREREVGVYESQVAGCERGNIIRRELNKRGRNLRRYAATISVSGASPEVREAAVRLRASTDFLAVPSCADLFPKP